MAQVLEEGRRVRGRSDVGLRDDLDERTPARLKSIRALAAVGESVVQRLRPASSSRCTRVILTSRLAPPAVIVTRPWLASG
jgi:hypothetical protein